MTEVMCTLNNDQFWVICFFLGVLCTLMFLNLLFNR